MVARLPSGLSPFHPGILLPAPDDFDYDAALAACAQGQPQALAQIYRRESRYLLGVALRIVRQRPHAEDVLHDAFVAIWQRAATFDAARGAGRGWIYSVVRNTALNWVRNHARDVPVDEKAGAALEDNMAVQDHASTRDAAETRVDLGRLDGCLEQLEPGRRECIVLAYVDGCSHGEIAERMKTPLGTVKAWIQRGMRALRECMG